MIRASDVVEIRPGPQRIVVRAAAVDAERRGVRRPFPFNLLEGPPDKVDDPKAEPKSGHRRIELPSEHEVIQLLGADDGR
ncbi:MAG: hypothetical protein M3188_08460 [Actinomycetota bacterium]|nr:hypothetical protein [Actinomycetota bacterium]